MKIFNRELNEYEDLPKYKEPVESELEDMGLEIEKYLDTEKKARLVYLLLHDPLTTSLEEFKPDTELAHILDELVDQGIVKKTSIESGTKINYQVEDKWKDEAEQFIRDKVEEQGFI